MNIKKAIITSFITVLFLIPMFATPETVYAQGCQGYWSLSAGQTTGYATLGNIWAIQPVLMDNCVNYTYPTVGGYISRFQWMQSMGYSGPLSMLINVYQSIIPWYLSGWQASGCNSWITQPVLTIDGTSYTYSTPQPYISQFQWLQSMGVYGPVSQMINELQQNAVPYFNIQPPNINISASPSSITKGQSSTLSWSVSNANTCSASGAWSGSKSTSSGTQSVSPSSTSTYTLSCSTIYNCMSSSRSATITVTVPQVPLSVPGSAGPITKLVGELFTLNWGAANTVSCSVSGPGLSSSDCLAGSSPQYRSTAISRSTPGDYVYTITGTGSDGQPKTASATVHINPAPQPPPSCSFSAAPSNIVPPQTTSLSWTCSDAQTCSIDQGIGSVTAPSGSKNISPSKTTSYMLTCTGPGGSNNFSTTITVAKPFIKEVLPQ